MAVKYPNITIDIAKCDDTIDIEGKVHGQMKRLLLPRENRRQFTRAIREGKSWSDAIIITKAWVNIKEHYGRYSNSQEKERTRKKSYQVRIL